uniref:Uncharacterized protein n=1 Tax=Cacopsylla melanoneura TaxID=428564 RepID=A0A8D8TR52_9HEMI
MRAPIRQRAVPRARMEPRRGTVATRTTMRRTVRTVNPPYSLYNSKPPIALTYELLLETVKEKNFDCLFLFFNVFNTYDHVFNIPWFRVQASALPPQSVR